VRLRLRGSIAPSRGGKGDEDHHESGIRQHRFEELLQSVHVHFVPMDENIRVAVASGRTPQDGRKKLERNAKRIMKPPNPTLAVR
jgi:hypothetical protein